MLWSLVKLLQKLKLNSIQTKSWKRSGAETQMPTIKNIEGKMVSVGFSEKRNIWLHLGSVVKSSKIELWIKVVEIQYAEYAERHIIIETLNYIYRYPNLNRFSERSLMSLKLNQRMFSFIIS